jgi:ribokinase
MSHSSAVILVAGAINTDLVATMKQAPNAGETITGTGFAVHGGGKGANQAVAAARSQAKVHLLGAVGDDDFGRARLSDLGRDGLHLEWVQTNPEVASGVALIFVEDGGENRIAYVPGATLTVSVSQSVAAIKAIQPEFLLATNELPHESLLALFEIAKTQGARVVLNATPDPGTVRELIEFVSVLVVNEGEAAILLDVEDHGDPVGSVAKLRELGIDTVVLTVGKDGVFIGDDRGVGHHRPPAVEVVDTTGAGDTFCGAFVAELARGTTVDEAARFAVAASSLSVTREGAQSSIPTRDEVLAWIEVLP